MYVLLIPFGSHTSQRTDEAKPEVTTMWLKGGTCHEITTVTIPRGY